MGHGKMSHGKIIKSSKLSLFPTQSHTFSFLCPLSLCISPVIGKSFMATFLRRVAKSNQKWHIVVTLIKLQIIPDRSSPLEC